jgi:hypothetical protein
VTVLDPQHLALTTTGFNCTDDLRDRQASMGPPTIVRGNSWHAIYPIVNDLHRPARAMQPIAERFAASRHARSGELDISQGVRGSERSCVHGHSALFRASCRHAGGRSPSFSRG